MGLYLCPHFGQVLENVVSPSSASMERAHLVVDLAKDAPELAASLAVMPAHLAVAKILSKIVGKLAALRDDQLDKEQKMARGGFHYLLKVGSLDKA